MGGSAPGNQYNDQEKRKDDTKESPGPKPTFGLGVLNTSDGKDHNTRYHQVERGDSSYQLLPLGRQVSAENLHEKSGDEQNAKELAHGCLLGGHAAHFTHPVKVFLFDRLNGESLSPLNHPHVGK